LKTLEIVTSAFNEEECLPELFTRIKKVMVAEKDYDWKLTVIDNGSFDNSWKIIKKQTLLDENITGIKMSRNFSLDSAFTCGLDMATSDIVIVLTSDLQDPPEQIPSLLRLYESGADQVVVRIKSREQVPIMRKVFSKIFYFVANKMTEGMLPKSVSDFRLMNKDVYTSIRNMRESHRFFRGIAAWVGFKTEYIEIERPNRFAGDSKWLKTSLTSILLHASKSILAYSSVPLVWITFAGLIISFFSFFSLIILTILWQFNKVPFDGYGTIVGIIILGFSITMFSIGILAQYIGLIYEEVKGRPLYIVAEKSTKS
jgi:glycosyltransferase involved in cell wall biosynthesis